LNTFFAELSKHFKATIIFSGLIDTFTFSPTFAMSEEYIFTPETSKTEIFPDISSTFESRMFVPTKSATISDEGFENTSSGVPYW